MTERQEVRLRELRELKGLSQQELASLMKVSPVSIWKWENGKDMMLSNAKKLKQILDPTNQYRILF